MTLKSKAALTYILPLLAAYGALIALSSIDGRSAWLDIAMRTLPASALAVLASLFQDIVPKPVKEFFVFYRLRNRLPGHRAYTKICVGDPRIDANFLARMRKGSRSDPERQNVEWYGQYRAVSTEPSVMHENFRYLAWRDLTATLIVLGLLSTLLVPAGTLPITRTALVAACCIAAAILTGTAARHAASSLVRNVVSLNASKKAV